MAQTRLNPKLLAKIADRTGKSAKYVREQISKRAARAGIVSEAAQVLWAQELGIGSGTAHRNLAPHIQEQVLAGRRKLAAPARAGSEGTESAARVPRQQSALSAAIEYLLTDPELRTRCSDLLRAQKSFDRVFREATVVLDARLKQLSGIKEKMNPGDLVARVLHPKRAILVVSEHEDEQQGFFELCKGMMAAFRNPVHHTLNDQLTREDALRFCGFTDSLLGILGKARVVTPEAKPSR